MSDPKPIKGTVERVESQAFKKKDGTDGMKYMVLVEGFSYQCWDKSATQLVNKPLPEGTTYTPAPEGTNWHPTLNLPKAAGSTGGGFQKRPYSPKDDSTTAWDTILMQAVEVLKIKSSMGLIVNKDGMDEEVKKFHDHWWKQYLKDMKEKGTN